MERRYSQSIFTLKLYFLALLENLKPHWLSFRHCCCCWIRGVVQNLVYEASVCQWYPSPLDCLSWPCAGVPGTLPGSAQGTREVLWGYSTQSRLRLVPQRRLFLGMFIWQVGTEKHSLCWHLRMVRNGKWKTMPISAPVPVSGTPFFSSRVRAAIRDLRASL